MTDFSWRTRNESLRRFSQEAFDVLIIGGGITGAGLALDAASRGLRVALAEKRDFAAGTSSRSTKLIHGGLRYLEHFEFALVREGLHERSLLLKNAPHLAEPFRFLIPIYADAKRNYDRPVKMRAGLFLYDLLAGGRRIGRHERISRGETLRLAPQLDGRGLKGAFVYYDSLTDDSRLVIEIVKTAHERGAVIANYAKVTGFLHNDAGQISGARIRDEATGREHQLGAKLLINATGVWVEEVIRQGQQNAGRLAANTKQVRPSKGVHITVPLERLRVETACLIPSLTGHRFYFVVPWEGRVNVGTTDTDYTGDKDAPRAQGEEIAEILNAVNSYFPEARLTTADVISSWAGLRPLIRDPGAASTTEVSRKEEILEGENGLITIAGGKLTTYRMMAERGVDLAVRRLQERFGLNKFSRCDTADIILGGGAIGREAIPDLAAEIVRTHHLSQDTAHHLVTAYGTESAEVCRIAGEVEGWSARLVERQPHLVAEVIYAVRHEMAVRVADVLARRTRLLMLGGRDALFRARLVAEWMATEIGWDKAEVDLETERLTEEFEREYTTGR